MKEKIIVASDHAGYGLKQKIRNWLERNNYAVEDLGCFSEERCDYPDYAEKAAKAVEQAAIKTIGRMSSMSAGRMGMSTSQVGDCVVKALE